jgi:hypothetical protein
MVVPLSMVSCPVLTSVSVSRPDSSDAMLRKDCRRIVPAEAGGLQPTLRALRRRYNCLQYRRAKGGRSRSNRTWLQNPHPENSRRR